jgi:polyketide cyclase/dehydrase/lipid transport protein
MRLLDSQTVALPLILLLLALAGPLFATLWPQGPLAASDLDVLEVKTESGGGVRATAHVLFPAKPEVIQALLTDYLHWPELFVEGRVRLAEFNVHEGVAMTDLRIEHLFLPGERRLVTESRALPNGGLVTDLKAGDFKRYHRVWKLSPAGEGSQTSAEFELIVEIESMVPDWVIAKAMRQELEAHFRIVKQKALQNSKR